MTYSPTAALARFDETRKAQIAAPPSEEIISIELRSLFEAELLIAYKETEFLSPKNLPDDIKSFISALLTKHVEQAVAEERMRAEDRLREVLEQEFYGEAESLISGQGWEEKVIAVLSALQDPRRGGSV